MDYKVQGHRDQTLPTIYSCLSKIRQLFNCNNYLTLKNRVLPDLFVLSLHQFEAHCTVGLWLDLSDLSAHCGSGKTRLFPCTENIYVLVCELKQRSVLLPHWERLARTLFSTDLLGFWHVETLCRCQLKEATLNIRTHYFKCNISQSSTSKQTIQFL